MDPENETNFNIRLATLEDTAELAILSAELGYPASQTQIRDRLQHLLSRSDHVVYVIQNQDGAIVGWIHAYLRWLLISGLSAEIGGIVIGKAYRRRGLGKRLIQHIEKWANRHGCKSVALYSGMQRDTAHQFYPNIGFTRIKSSWKYEKELSSE